MQLFAEKDGPKVRYLRPAAAKAHDLESLSDAHLRLSDILSEHHAQEEEILFPTMDESFEPKQLTGLIEKLLLA